MYGLEEEEDRLGAEDREEGAEEANKFKNTLMKMLS